MLEVSHREPNWPLLVQSIIFLDSLVGALSYF